MIYNTRRKRLVDVSTKLIFYELYKLPIDIKTRHNNIINPGIQKKSKNIQYENNEIEFYFIDFYSSYIPITTMYFL